MTYTTFFVILMSIWLLISMWFMFSTLGDKYRKPSLFDDFLLFPVFILVLAISGVLYLVDMLKRLRRG